MHPKFRKFLWVSIKGRVFQFKTLLFRLRPDPWLFAKVAREFALLIHSQNTALHQFLDDWLGQAMSKECCVKHRHLVLLLCKELGWLVNWEKS